MNPKYEKIINIKHHYPKNHRIMPIENRAAQFAPFAALTGYEESIQEVGREVEKKRELLDSEKDIINDKLRYIIDNKIQGEVKVIYFIKDNKKDGGKYEEMTSSIRRIDEENRVVIFKNKMKISIDDIVKIYGDFFHLNE